MTDKVQDLRGELGLFEERLRQSYVNEVQERLRLDGYEIKECATALERVVIAIGRFDNEVEKQEKMLQGPRNKDKLENLESLKSVAANIKDDISANQKHQQSRSAGIDKVAAKDLESMEINRLLSQL